jgi:uncharacterized protein YeaO (DUF488 family)
MPLRTQRWHVPREPEDGRRILVCRYRPRGLPKSEETWDEWLKELGPSPALFADFKGKAGPPISLGVYKERYVAEMSGPSQQALIATLAARVDRGETVTLLCSKDCFLPEACHRTVLAQLIEARRARPPTAADPTRSGPCP